MGRAQVVQYHRIRRDVAVVRLVGDFVPFEPGQSVLVTTPAMPHQQRRYSPAMPPSRDGKFEFHVRAIPAGWVSGSVVRGTREGDVWELDSPAGTLAVDDADETVVMVAGGTGLAPLFAILLDLSRRPRPPRVHLFLGGRTPRDLYAADMVWLMRERSPWLSVTPVVEQRSDPGWTDEFFDAAEAQRRAAMPESQFAPTEYAVGTVGDVAARHGPYPAARVLVCGSPAMVDHTHRTLVAAGTPSANIRR